MTIGELLIKLGVDSAALNSGFRGAASEAQNFGANVSHHAGIASKALGGLEAPIKGVGKLLSGLGGIATVGLGMLAAQATMGLVDNAKHAMDLVTAEDAINKQTAAALASTKDASNMTAKSVDDLANSIMKMSGIDDETVKTTENMLLTFTNIRNEVGKGNDVFDQATLAATNMSVALGEDGKSAAMQLGKALNDPIAGVTALQRVGVKLTETQKEQIKLLVKHGDTLGAQKIILGELTTEFGGSAKAFGDSSAGAMAKITNSVDEAEKGFARLVLPMAEAGLQLLPPLIDGVASFATEVGGMVDQFMKLPAVEGIIGSITGLFGSFFGGNGQQFSEYGGELIDNLAAGIEGAAPGVVDGLLGLLEKAQLWMWNTGVPMLANAASKLFDTLAKVLPPAIQKVLAYIGKMLPVFIGKLGEWGKALVGWVGERLPSLLASLGDMAQAIGNWLINVGLPQLGQNLVKWGTALVQWIGPQIPPLLAALGDMLGKIAAWIVNPGIPTLFARMADMGRSMVAALMDFLVGRNGQTGMLQQIAGWFTGTLLPALPGLAVQVGQGFVSMWLTIEKMMANAVAGAMEFAVNLIVDAVNSLQIHFGGLSTPFGTLAKFDWSGLGLAHLKLPRLEAGTDWFGGGAALVGERGPEIVNLPRGSSVTPADRTASMLGAGKGPVYLTINNPKAEPASMSAYQGLRKLSVLGYVPV